MLHFVFTPAIQAGIASGLYEVVRNKATGELIGLVRNKATGKFVAHAIGAVVRNSPLSPFLMGAQLALPLVQIVQTHLNSQETNRRIKGVSQQVEGVSLQVEEVNQQVQQLNQFIFQSLPATLGVLQASTAVIGVGVVAVAALSAVNLYQTMKLREDVKQLRLEVKDGFIDLKEALKDQGKEIIERINQVAQDVEFRHHRTILVVAYGRFLQATKLMEKALFCQDLSIRNSTLQTAQAMLANALADYNNPQLLSDTCAAGLLRRYECAWVIEQTMAMVFQMQEQPAVVSQSLSDLKNRIR
ncbi:MAG TPA: hypothetical protein VIQ31_27015, partial [Phormidium sp.]